MLFTIHPAENCFVTSTSRGGFKVLNKATGVARIVGGTSCADARVLRAEPKQALSLKRVLADECDGRHACRYHGASCPEIVIRKRLVLARAKVQMDLLEKRASRKAAVRGQRVATNEELRALFEQRRNHFMMEFEGYAPHKFEYLVWGMLAQDVISAGLDLTLCGFLTHKERNKLMHAMNGNIMSGIANNKKLWYAKRDFKAVLLFCAGRPKQGAQMFTQLHPADQVVSDVEEQVRVTPVPPVEVANARTSFRDLIDTKYDAIKKKVESRHMLALDSEILADEVDLQHVASAFISAHPRFQQYAEVFGADRMNELARLADLEARGAKRLVVSNRARVAKALKDGELPKTYGILRDSPAWLAPFGVSLIKFGELVDKALNDAGIDPITRPLPSNACGPMSSSSAASAAGNVVKGVGNHVRVKQAEGSQLMHNHHRLARNSSQSDIETNPGPSVSGIMTQLLNSAAGVLSIPFGDSHHLQFSVHANIQEADRMQRDVTTIGGVKILDEWKSVSLSDKAKTARRDVDALLRPCDCDAPDGAGLWLVEASLSKSLRKAKVPKDRFSIGHMGLLTAQLCRNHLDDIRAIIANGSNMIHVDQVDDDVLDDRELVAQVYQFEPCQVKEHTPAVMRAELFKLPSRVLGSQLDFETDLSDWGFGHVKCNICNAYEYGFVRNLPAEPLVTGHQLLPTFGKMFWQIIEAASSHSFSERCLWIYVPDGQLPDVSAVAQGFEIVFLIDSEFFEDTEIPDGTDKLELPNFLDNWDLLGVRMFANIAAPLSFNVVVASNTLFKLPTEISTIPIMSARLTGDVLGIGECSTLLLDECLFVGTYQQLFVLDELAEPLTFWRFQNEPSNMIICESPDISDAVSLVPSIANPRTAAHVEVAIMWVGSTRKCVYIPDATSINLSVAKSVLDPATSSLGGLSDALAFLRYPINEAHVGREFMITPDLLPWAPPRPIMCGCLFCNIRAHYGPIVFPIYGTTGDRNPIRAVARQLLRWGIDIIFLELQPLDVGIDDLERIHSGELLHLIPKYSGFKGLIASLPYITIGTPDLDAEISILLDPPPSALKEYDWRLGPILNPVISFLSGHMSTHPRIAAYPGWTHLPRSMDGHTFLEWSKVPREGRPDKVLWMIGSARVKIPVDAKQIIPGDHWPQLERAECVYTHGGAGSVQAAHCAGVSRIVVLDPMGDRGYKDLNNAGAGVSPGQDPDRALLLLLGHDFLPLILAYRSSFMLGLNALVWYFKLFAIPDLITVMTLFMISNEMGSFVLVPGSVVMTFVGSLAAMLFGRGVSIVLAIALQIWGMTLLRRLGVSPPAIAMKILRIGRLVGNSPYAALFWAAGYRRTAIVNLIIEKMGIPFYALCVKAYREPRGYIDFVYVAELSFLPMHTRFVSLDLKTVVEGGPLHDGPKGLYRLVRREYTTGDDDNLCIRFPILLDPLSINLQAQSIGEYILILHNCQTVMLASMDGAFMLMGPALLLMVPMFILAVVFGLTSLLTLGLFTLLIMVYLFTAGEDITPAMAFIKTVMNRYRALVLMARLKERESVWSQVLKSALAMAYSPGLTEEDRIAFDAAIRFNASVDAAIDTDHLLQTYATALQDLVNAIPGLADYAGSFGAFAGLSRLPIDLSVAAFVAQDMEEARNIDLLDRILNSAKVLAKVGVLEFENLKFEFEALDDLDAFIEARFQNPTLILLQDIFHAIAEHQVDTSFLVDFIELLPNVSNTFELLKELFASHTSATCNESSELVRQILSRCQTRSDIFIRPFILDDPIAQQIDVEYDAPLTQDEILRLAGQAAVGMAVGCDVHESIMQSIEMSADFLHDGSVPFCDAESAAYRDLSRYYETTRPIRDIFGSCLNGITWLRDYIVRKHHYTFSLMPLHAIFGFLGLLCSVSLAFGARVCIAAIVTCCQMIGIDERVIYDIGGQIAFFIQMLDPAHRANPKPVWALLWKRKRANVSKGEALLFSIMPSTFVKAESYSDWVDQMAHLLDGSDVDVTKLWRVPPERAVYYPDNTYGLSEYLELPISVQTHFKETARERKLLEDSIAAGNGLAIDGAWLARPEHVTASIERYTVERPVVSFGAKAAITAAADALFDHYKELYDMPKPMTVADVMKNSKWKYAAGLPFMPYIRKRQTLQQTSWYDAIARAATKILETGRMPAVGLHGFPKAQVVSAERLLKDPSAMRTVTAGDRITAIAVNTLLMERNKRVGNIDAGLLNMMRRSEGSIVQIGQDIRRFPNMYSGDATRFDSTVVAEVATVGSVRLYQRGIDSFGVYNSKAAVSVVHAYYEALTHGLIVNLIDGSVVWKTGGGGTGSAATTPDNRDWTRMVMIASWALTMGLPARDFFKHVKLTNASDDVFFSVDNQTDAKLQDWVNTMKTEYGVRFAFTREENLNNILHLVKVPEEEVDREIYSVLGVDPPVDSLRVSPKRMLLMRSAYRSDRMKLNNAVAATYLADRSTGYQLLSAHSPDIYNLVTQDLIDAQLAYMSEHFATATAMIGRSESGLINDYHIDLGTQRPARSLVKAAKRAARRNPGRPDYEAHYIAEAQRKAKIWLRQRRGKSYRDVMSLWIKTPPPPSDGRSGRRWQRINAVASAIGPLSDLVRLGVIKLSTISEIVPKALTSITPEIATLGVNRPFMTWDFTIEQYIWRREFVRIGKAPPISRLHELIRQSPYAAITDIAGFEALLRNETVLRALVAATTSNRSIRGSIWAVSNDAVTGRVICILALYTTIDLIIRFMEQKLIFGVFIMAAFGIFRLLDVFYSLQSLAFWVCTGMASLAISNTVPRDKYILQKKLSVILAALVPGFVTDYWFGVFAALPYLAKIIELQAIVPWLILAANTEMSQKVLQQGTGSFDLALEFWINNDFEMFLLGGVGSGKSTALPAALAHLYPRTQLVVLVPTNALVTNYVNDFLEDNRVLRVHREYPRDTKFVHNLVVMTYAQFWRRVGQLATSPIVLFDECHVASNDIFLAYQECKTMDVRRIYLTATFGGEFCAYLPHVVRYQQPDRVMPFIRSAPVIIPDTGNLNSDYVTAVRKAIADGAEPHSIMSYHPSIKTLRLWSTAFTGMGTPIRFITADHTDASSRSAVFVTGVVAMGANIRPPPKVLIYAPKILVPVHRYPTDDHGAITIRSGDLLNHISLVYVDMPAVDKHQLEGRVGREANGSIYIIGNAVGPPLPARINLSELSMLQSDRVDALLLQVSKYPGFLVQQDSDVFLGFFLVDRQNEQLASLGCAFAALVLSLGTFPAVFDCIAFARHSTEHADALANSNFFLQQFGLSIPPVLNFWAGLAAFCQTCTLCLEHEQRSSAIPIFANNGIVIYDLSLIAQKLQVHERPFSARIALAGEVLSNLPKFALRDVSETLVSSITPAIYFDFDTPGVDQMITLLGGVAVITPIIIRLMQLQVRICEPRLIHFSCCPSELAMGNMYLCVGTYEQFFVVFDTDSNLLFISGLHHVRAQIHVSVATREVTMPLLLPHLCHQIFLDQEERSPPL